MSKIGRNDSCPCGSGVKYKKCCMSADIAKVVDSRAKAANVSAKNSVLTSAYLKQMRKVLVPGGYFGLRISERMVVQFPYDRLDQLISIWEKNEAKGLKPEEYDLPSIVKACGGIIETDDAA